MDVERVSLILQSHLLDGVMGALSSILVLYPSLIHLYVYDRFTRVLWFIFLIKNKYSKED